jgi:hypothetical protein
VAERSEGKGGNLQEQPETPLSSPAAIKGSGRGPPGPLKKVDVSAKTGTGALLGNQQEFRKGGCCCVFFAPSATEQLPRPCPCLLSVEPSCSLPSSQTPISIQRRIQTVAPATENSYPSYGAVLRRTSARGWRSSKSRAHEGPQAARPRTFDTFSCTGCLATVRSTGSTPSDGSLPPLPSSGGRRATSVQIGEKGHTTPSS